MVGGTQAAKVLSAHSPHGTSVQYSFHHLRFEQPYIIITVSYSILQNLTVPCSILQYLERHADVLSIVQLGTVCSDTRPSGADVKLNPGAEVRALANSTPNSSSTVAIVRIQLKCGE